MSKKMSMTYTGSFAKAKHSKEIEFYSSFIKAIEGNSEMIINKRNCIDNLEKVRDEMNEKMMYKTLMKMSNQMKSSMKKENKYHTKDKVLKFINEEQEKEQKEIIKMINEQREKSNKILGKEEEEKKEDVTNENNVKDVTSLNTSQNGIIVDNVTTPLKESLSPAEPTKENSPIKNEKAKPTVPQKKKRHLYTVFRNCRIYLESNNIMLTEFVQYNQFHPRPSFLQYSEEFLEAVKFGKYENVKTALKSTKSYLFVYDYLKQTAYHWAAKLGDVQMLELLISNGKYLNQYDAKKRTPLYLASMNNQYECCVLLVKNNANCFMEDIKGKKPLDVTTTSKIKVLLSDQMDNKYTNPYIKHRINVILKMREDNIAKILYLHMSK